jgi:hypothetical protein
MPQVKAPVVMPETRFKQVKSPLLRFGKEVYEIPFSAGLKES